MCLLTKMTIYCSDKCMTDPRPNVLYVFAHPDAYSFNAQLFAAGYRALSTHSNVEVSNLYAMGFDPVLSQRDLGPDGTDTEPAGSSTFLEQWRKRTLDDALPADVTREQEKLRRADLVIFHFPLWWYSLPALLKGWIDRVLSAGFGFDVIDPATGRTRKYGDGLLRGKRALITVSYGETEAALGPRGIAGDLDTLLFGFTHGTLFYTGMEVLPTHAIASADGLDADRVHAEISRYEGRLLNVHAEAPIRYRTQHSGDYHPGRRLQDQFAPGRTDMGIHRADR